jgi:hypothetical protein
VLKASQIMDPNFPILSTRSTQSDLKFVLSRCEKEKNRYENCLNIEVAYVDEKNRFLGILSLHCISLIYKDLYHIPPSSITIKTTSLIVILLEN